MTEVRYVDSGIGNNFGSFIELNKHLKNYPKLHDSILTHELRHSNTTFSKQDFIHDISDDKIGNWDLIKFMIRHPKSFSQLLPFYWQKDKGFVYDINASIIWGVMLLISGGVVLSLI